MVRRGFALRWRVGRRFAVLMHAGLYSATGTAALATDAAMLPVDEPFRALDPLTRDTLFRDSPGVRPKWRSATSRRSLTRSGTGCLIGPG